ncbi:hypothetical protein PENTCL1PPCAC_26082, partial [Pristionchus entomophagus]
DDSLKFLEVSSNLVIVGGRKVTVTMGEIRRRMSAPECQGWKGIARLTRHARTSWISFQKK